MMICCVSVFCFFLYLCLFEQKTKLPSSDNQQVSIVTLAQLSSKRSEEVKSPDSLKCSASEKVR